eukprot:1148423-Pelagomonas_calceolata.AAC.1
MRVTEGEAHLPNSLPEPCLASLRVSRMILRLVSEGSYGSNLVHMDVGCTDRSPSMTFTSQSKIGIIPRHLFDPSIPDQLDATPAALMLSWSLLALLTQLDHPLPPHIK